MSDVSKRMEKVFRKIFPQDGIGFTRKLTAFDVQGWDSLKNVHLLIALEKEFKIKFVASEVVRTKNIGELMDLIEKKSKGG